MPISRTRRGPRALVLLRSAVASAIACSALLLGGRPAAAHATLLAVSPGAALTSPGTWTLTVTAVRSGVPGTFTIEVPVR